MAVGFDPGFIALEVAVLAAPADKRAPVVRCPSAPAIAGTLARVGCDERLRCPDTRNDAGIEAPKRA
jgi:hypothetical protein